MFGMFIPIDDPIGNTCGLEACPKLNPNGTPADGTSGARRYGFRRADTRSCIFLSGGSDEIPIDDDTGTDGDAVNWGTKN